MRELFSTSFNHLVNFLTGTKNAFGRLLYYVSYIRSFICSLKGFSSLPSGFSEKGVSTLQKISHLFLWKTSSSDVFTSKFIWEKFSLYEVSIKTSQNLFTSFVELITSYYHVPRAQFLKQNMFVTYLWLLLLLGKENSATTVAAQNKNQLFCFCWIWGEGWF